MSDARGARREVSLATARRLWFRRQGLGPAGAPSAESAAERSGWIRTLGGIDAYLALFARVPTLRRRDLDSALADEHVRVVPAVRGCIYLVPSADVPLALAVAADQSRTRNERELTGAGVTSAELADVAAAIVDALGDAALTTDQVRAALPAGTVRSLGEAGKKAGITSTLPPALRSLELAGTIQRLPDQGRLDRERYLWRRTTSSGPALGDPYPGLAQRFLQFAGPAATADFASWSGLGKRAAEEALRAAPAEQVSVPGYADDAWLLHADRAAVEAAGSQGAEPEVAFLAFEDNLLSLHGGPAALVAERHTGRDVPNWGRPERAPLGDARHLSLRPVVVDGELVGFWEFSVDTDTVHWRTFEPISSAAVQACAARADALGRFIVEECGHAKSFSLDTEAELRSRLEEVLATS